MKRFKTGVLLLFLAMGVLPLSGCTRQDWADLRDIALMWARAHDVVDENNKPTFSAGFRVFTGASTGDEQADAVIDAGMVVDNFQKAENLAEDGRENRDPAKLGQAINLRPGEYRYRNRRGAIFITEGKEKEAEADFAAADRVAGKYGKAAQLKNIDSRRDSLAEEWNRQGFWTLDKRGYDTKGRRETPERLATRKRHLRAYAQVYRQRYALSGEKRDLDLAEAYEQDLADLP